MNVSKYFWTGLVGFFVFISCGSALSGGNVRKFGGEKPVTIEDLRPHISNADWYNEKWNHNVYMQDGSFIAVDFRITNVAVGSDQDGFFHARFKDPRGKVVKCEAELDEDEWSSAKSGFSLDFGKGKVSGDLDGLRVQVGCKNLSMDLHFKNQIPPYKPGGGALRFGKDDGIYSIVYHSPRSQVTGTVTLRGKSRQIEGVGYATRSHYNMRPDKQVRRWFRFREVDQDYSLMMTELEASPEYYLTRNGWVLLTDNKDRIVATSRVRFEYDGFIQDSSAKEGYKLPRRVRVLAVEGDTQMTGLLLMKRIKKVVDPTAKMGAVRRAFVRRFSKPRDYHIECSYKFSIKTKDTTRKIEGTGLFRFLYVNP